MEVQPSFKEWQDFFEGCVGCHCDHGCNQWVAEQSSKVVLFMRILSNKGSTSLDRVAQMELKKANKILFRIYRWEGQKYNRWLRSQR